MDLPGYGFAKVSKAEQAKWATTAPISASGEPGVGDPPDRRRRGPTALDLQTVEWLESLSARSPCRRAVCASKSKKRRTELTEKPCVARSEVTWVSADKGTGIPELRATVCHLPGAMTSISRSRSDPPATRAAARSSSRGACRDEPEPGRCQLQIVRDPASTIDTAASYGERARLRFSPRPPPRVLSRYQDRGAVRRRSTGSSWNRVLSVWVSTESTSSNSTTSSNRTSGRPPSPLTVPWPLCSLPSTRGWLAQSA